MFRRFADGPAPMLYRIDLLNLGLGHAAPMGQLPYGLVLRRIVLAVDHIATAFEDQSFEALFGKLFSGPAAGYPGSDDNCVIGFLLLNRKGMHGGAPSYQLWWHRIATMYGFLEFWFWI